MVNTWQPYAQAIYLVAKEANQLDQVKNELKDIAGLVNSQSDVKAFLKHPSVPKEKKAEILLSCVQEPKGYLGRFLQIMASKNLVNDLPALYDAFLMERREDLGIEVVKVTSAAPLQEDYKAKLIALLEKKLAKQVELDERIDASVLAGVKLEGKEFVLDNTLDKKARLISEEIMRVQTEK